MSGWEHAVSFTCRVRVAVNLIISGNKSCSDRPVNFEHRLLVSSVLALVLLEWARGSLSC